ncbi:MAG: hypothetical protein KGJ23_16135 [Euryarchaeota archaeon]|nr:hypothetical protein [Euryarchaeota archaeon]MDE1838128.1 hypothetical protein [Euryarchaeota archaeon]MDE1880341.1 hypothetical protein [Euryarchaeota archaeon]MDE2046606.1 hypothetical protein [Thermoplasmata archaeon]
MSSPRPPRELPSPIRPRLLVGALVLSMLLLPMLASGAAVAHVATISGLRFTHGHGGGGGSGSCGTNGVTSTQSTNWGGYAAETCLSNPASNSVSDVKGSWVQPAVTCGNTASYAAFWVGIDGYSSSTVEQTGTDSDCSSGQPTYYAWYEFYPAYPVNLDKTKYTVSPGDSISAEVLWTAGSSFTVSVSDSNPAHSWTFTTVGTVNNAARSSAEWIAEAPSSGHVLPLANFGTVQFTSCTATIGGVNGGIQNPTWAAAEITMVGHSYAKATPSGLTSSYQDFSVVWDHS